MDAETLYTAKNSYNFNVLDFASFYYIGDSNY